MLLHSTARESTGIQQLRLSLTEVVHRKISEICRPFLTDIKIGQLLSDIILESLLHREDEWRLRGVEPSEAGVSEIIELIHPSLVILLSEAKVGAMNEGRERLLLIDVLAGIVPRWCQIFPFCR